MSLGTIAGTRMWGCAGPFAIADSCQGARSRFVPPWDAWLICDHGARFAHWPIIPRGASRIGQSSHGGRLICANQVWIVLIMHSLICSSACSIPPSVEGSTSGTSRGAQPLGMSPRLIPPHSVRIFTCALASLMHYLNARPPPNAHPKIQ